MTYKLKVKSGVMMDEFYNETVMEHFMSPRNMHAIENADAEGYFGDPSCGDYLVIFIKVDNEIITDIGLLVYGCPASIATSSVTGELAKGKSLDEALKITDQDVVDALGGLPEHKQHCSLLAVSALRNAIEEYKKKFASSEVSGED
jgi:nitrogen fixation NifU-like protein